MSISKILESLGYIFPSNSESVIEFEKKFKDEIKNARPEYWNNPLEILKNDTPKIIVFKRDNNFDNSDGLSQAAREGKKISEEMKRKMLQDRNNAKNKG